MTVRHFYGIFILLAFGQFQGCAESKSDIATCVEILKVDIKKSSFNKDKIVECLNAEELVITAYLMQDKSYYSHDFIQNPRKADTIPQVVKNAFAKQTGFCIIKDEYEFTNEERFWLDENDSTYVIMQFR